MNFPVWENELPYDVDPPPYNWCEITEKLKTLQTEIAAMDDQKFLYIYDHGYYSPEEAHRIKQSLLSMTAECSNEILNFSMNIYHDGTNIYRHEFINWTLITYKLCCIMLSIFHKIFLVTNHTDPENCFFYDQQAYYHFQHFLYLLRMQGYETIMKSSELPQFHCPSLLSSAFKIFINTQNDTNLNRNKLLKILVDKRSDRQLGFKRIPYLKPECMWYVTQVIIDIKLTRLQDSYITDENYHKTRLCQVCDPITIYFPIDFCFHKCFSCQGLCKCRPCISCAQNRHKYQIFADKIDRMMQYSLYIDPLPVPISLSCLEEEEPYSRFRPVYSKTFQALEYLFL